MKEAAAEPKGNTGERPRANQAAAPQRPDDGPDSPAVPPHLANLPEETRKTLREISAKYGNFAEARFTVEVGPGRTDHDIELK